MERPSTPALSPARSNKRGAVGIARACNGQQSGACAIDCIRSFNDKYFLATLIVSRRSPSVPRSGGHARHGDVLEHEQVALDEIRACRQEHGAAAEGPRGIDCGLNAECVVSHSVAGRIEWRVLGVDVAPSRAGLASAPGSSRRGSPIEIFCPASHSRMEKDRTYRTWRCTAAMSWRQSQTSVSGNAAGTSSASDLSLWGIFLRLLSAIFSPHEEGPFPKGSSMFGKALGLLRSPCFILPLSLS